MPVCSGGNSGGAGVAAVVVVVPWVVVVVDGVVVVLVDDGTVVVDVPSAGRSGGPVVGVVGSVVVPTDRLGPSGPGRRGCAGRRDPGVQVDVRDPGDLLGPSLARGRQDQPGQQVPRGGGVVPEARAAGPTHMTPLCSARRP
jgi:hypothetical protein